MKLIGIASFLVGIWGMHHNKSEEEGRRRGSCGGQGGGWCGDMVSNHSMRYVNLVVLVPIIITYLSVVGGTDDGPDRQ